MREERLKKLQPSYFGKPSKKKGDQDEAAKKAAEEAAKKAAEEAAKKAAEEEAAKKAAAAKTNGKK